MSDTEQVTDKESPDKKEEVSKETPSGAGEAILNGNFRINMEDPLPYLDKGLIKAYRAVGGSRHGGNLFALLCDKSKTPRFAVQSKYMNISNPNLCRLVDAGKVFCPKRQQEYYCFVYDDSIGHPIAKAGDKNIALGWKPEEVLSNIVGPMVMVLKDLRNKELTHGEIWPGNIFDGGAKSGQKINLGECLSSPASSQLPSLYEPIERALSDPMGRGAGDIMDDLYSFGASLAVMLRSEDPMKGADEDQIIEYKIEKGSYAALLGKERLSGGVLELLRGLLFDDPAQRWTIEDLEAWLDGRRLSPKQAPKRVKATRPILFIGKKYTRPEVFAKDLYKDPNEAARLLAGNEMDQWVDRAIEDKIVKNRLEQAVQDISNYKRGGSFNDRAAVSIAHALYPDCCVRYRNIHFSPQGFGKYLTETYVQKADIEPFVDVLKYNFITPIIRHSRSLERNMVVSNFESARSALKQKGMNSDLERCLYLMDPEAPCLSPILDQYYVQTTRDMMNAFEKICEKESKATILFDRHIISFLSVKDKLNIDPYLSDISSPDPRIRIVGQLKVLATIQKRLGLGGYPAISKWLLDGFGPVFSYFHDSKKSEALKNKVLKLVREGDLKSIAAVFDDDNLYECDLHAFHQAMEEYQKLVREKNLIETELGKGNRYGQNTGRQIASVISMLVAFLMMAFTVYQVFLGG